ncbi:MAG: DUF1207 domain-containing protein [Ignavibacteriaceae bacterium]|nr:DUF1207 domain-containing protein [Ignavibacteriaceae bacterium]
MTFCFILLLGNNHQAQEKSKFFPDQLLISPFKANFLEPKLGFSSMIGENEIRLDIGNSRDLYHYSDGEISYSAGADLFTFTRLSGEKEFHFPVEAVDYLFGINGGFKKAFSGYSIGVRGRLSHISAHFVDGHFDGTLGTWKNNRNPIVYSREFIEIIPFYETSNMRFYGGLTFLFHVVPNNIGRMIYQAGCEYTPELFEGSIIKPFLAYDFRLQQIGVSTSTNSAMLGIKFGGFNSSGVTIYLSYFSGMSVHGEYYDVREEYISSGLNIDI